jgi:hypothetical protein
MANANKNTIKLLGLSLFFRKKKPNNKTKKIDAKIIADNSFLVLMDFRNCR